MKKLLSNQPLKGTADWFPEEFRIRKYIFDTWRKVCLGYGYEEYLAPLVENADIYRAKSGEETGGTELITIKREGDEFAIRPEMTPSVTRMISQIYDSTAKPIRYFSIANFMRFQKPQRGRNREFWQLNYDIFGSNNLAADIEILQIALDIMLAFGSPKGSFSLCLNNRKLVDNLLEGVMKINYNQKTDVIRLMDKWDKLSKNDFILSLKDLRLDNLQTEKVVDFLSAKNIADLIEKIPELEDNQGLIEIQNIIETLQKLGYKDWICFQPNVIRGLDYYDGMIFEVYDNHVSNRRAMFGGGRYNGLAEIFGKQSFPAVGCAPGDETIRLFLESWNLIKKIENKNEIYYLPILDESLTLTSQKIANQLRKKGVNVEISLEPQKLGKALDYANKKSIAKVIIFGELERKKGIYKVKDMVSGKEKRIKL